MRLKYVLAAALLVSSFWVAASAQTPPTDRANEPDRHQLSTEEEARAEKLWSERVEQMHILVMRKLSGNNFHFRVDFVVPPDPELSHCDLVTVYGSQTREKGITYLPDQYKLSFKGSWKMGDPIQLLF